MVVALMVVKMCVERRSKQRKCGGGRERHSRDEYKVLVLWLWLPMGNARIRERKNE